MASTTVTHREVAAVMTAVERVAGAPVLRERARLPSEPARARYVAVRARFTRGAIYGHFRNKGELFVAMTNRVMLPMEMLVAASVDAGEPDPLARIRQLLVFCLGKAVVEPHSRRVFEVLFTKYELARKKWIPC